MSTFDKLFLERAGARGRIPILINLASTVTVLFLVHRLLSRRQRRGRGQRDEEPRSPRMSGLVALGGFVLRQWLKYQRQSLKYQKELTDNIYFRNVNNNAGIFDYIIGAAEEQECKEAFLAYYFLRTAATPPTADELAGCVGEWLRATFGVDVAFNVGEACGEARSDWACSRATEGGSRSRRSMPPWRELHRAWDDFFPRAPQLAAQ